jgi:plasmid maintenance system killer protein
MNITFTDRKLARWCSSEKEMRKKWGDQLAKKLRQRLAELEVFASLADAAHIPSMRCHELSGDRNGQIAVDLVHPYRLIFCPDDSPIPTKPDGGLDWSKMTKILIIEIEDYH